MRIIGDISNFEILICLNWLKSIEKMGATKKPSNITISNVYQISKKDSLTSTFPPSILVVDYSLSKFVTRSYNDTELSFHQSSNKTSIIPIEYIRDFKIEFSTSDTQDSFTVEQREKIEILKLTDHFESNYKKLVSFDDANSRSFKKGDRIWHKTMPGIITYKHKGEEIKFTIVIGDKYLKYVPGIELTHRIKEDLSKITIPKDITDKSTIDLLKLLKKSRVRGIGNKTIKAELSKREHIRNPKKSRKTNKKKNGKK